MTTPPSERAEADALLTDLYLDALLAARERHAVDAPDRRRPRSGRARRGGSLGRRPRPRPPLVPVRGTSGRPPGRSRGAAASRDGRRRRIDDRPSGGDPSRTPGDPATEIGAWPPEADPVGDSEGHDRGRPLLIGGALTSAAISIAGAAAYVAWRRARPTPMARAVRTVGRGRLTPASGPRPEALD